MTASTIVKPSWSADKVRDVYNNVFLGTIINARRILSKYGANAVLEFEAAQRAMRLEAYKPLGLKTPIQLVQAMAEMETNLFGSEISYSGSEQAAEITWMNCAIGSKCQNAGLSQQEQQDMFQCFSKFVDEIGAHYGFNATMERQDMVVKATFRK